MAPSNNETPANLRYNYQQLTEFKKELREELLRLMESEFKASEVAAKANADDATEAKKIAISARDKSMQPHDCSQVSNLAELKESVASWAKWWRGIMVTIIAAIIVFGATTAGWWYSHMAVKAEVVTLNTEVAEVKTAVEETNTNFEEFRVSFKKKAQKEEAGQQQQVQAIADAVGQVVQKELKKSRRR